MRAAWTGRLLSSSPDSVNADQARTELAAMSEALEATIRTVRRIASELRPPVLDALGLIPLWSGCGEVLKEIMGSRV